MHTETGATGEIENEESKNSTKVSNEYVLNVAFVSFFGFALFQIGFAIMADSQAMLADSEAMNIDAVTYLFNMCAERIKNRPISDYERELLVSERNYRRQMQRLCLELFPPLVSVFCLICITVATVREASQSLWGEKLDGDVDDDVSLPIMLIFSAMNLLLDVVNVTCFARADMNFGLDIVRNEAMDLRQSVTRRLSGEAKETVTETSSLLAMGVTDVESGVHNFREKTNLVNLNMCSAWTVRNAVSISTARVKNTILTPCFPCYY